jgi:hypothetical protein
MSAGLHRTLIWLHFAVYFMNFSVEIGGLLRILSVKNVGQNAVNKLPGFPDAQNGNLFIRCNDMYAKERFQI